MIPAYFILIAITITFYAFFFRLEHDWLEKAGVIAGVVATVVAVIAMLTANSTSGAYVTYVNGVRASAGYIKASGFIVFPLLFGGISIGLTRGIGYLIGHRRDADERQEPKVWVLVLSIIGVIFSVSFLQAGVSTITDASIAQWRRILVVVLGVVIFVTSIWGIVSYIIKKKRQANQ
jgi:hypothetical protein